MADNRENKLWKELNKVLAFLAAAVMILLLVAYYFIGTTDPQNDFWKLAKQLAVDVIANLIPVTIVFLIGFFLLRQIDQLRSEKENEQLAELISVGVKEAVREVVCNKDEVQDTSSDSDSVALVKKFFQTQSRRISAGSKNLNYVKSDFLKWEECTIMLGVNVPEKGRGLRNAPDYRYLLAHHTADRPEQHSPNMFALRYTPSGTWEVAYRGEQIEGAAKTITLGDELKPGWHQFVIAWSRLGLQFYIDRGEGGNRLIGANYRSHWPAKLRDSVAVGAYHPLSSGELPYDTSYCETEIYQLWIVGMFLDTDSELVVEHFAEIRG